MSGPTTSETAAIKHRRIAKRERLQRRHWKGELDANVHVPLGPRASRRPRLLPRGLSGEHHPSSVLAFDFAPRAAANARMWRCYSRHHEKPDNGQHREGGRVSPRNPVLATSAAARLRIGCLRSKSLKRVGSTRGHPGGRATSVSGGPCTHGRQYHGKGRERRKQDEPQKNATSSTPHEWMSQPGV